MCRAIDQAYKVDEVKDIRDKALAFEVYARQAKNPEPERRACEIRLRAERKAGQLLSKREKANRGPDKTGQGSQRATSDARTLSEHGISKDQSSRWQQLGDVPEEDFETALNGSAMPTTIGIIKKPRQDPSPWPPDHPRSYQVRIPVLFYVRNAFQPETL